MISKFAQAVINISAAVTYTVRSAILGLGLTSQSRKRKPIRLLFAFWGYNVN